MITSATFMPRFYAQEWEPQAPTAIISITEPGSDPVRFKGKYLAVLRLSFQDFTKDDGRGVAFSMEHAEKVAEFSRWLHDLPTDVELVVHCQEGRSRSAAVAQWIGSHFDVPVIGRPADIGTRLANTLVLRLLAAVLAGERPTLH